MDSAKNGQGVNCDVGVVMVGVVARLIGGRSKTQIRAKTPRMSPPNTQPTTLRSLLEATIPQKMGQKMNHSRKNNTSIMDLLT